MMIRVLRQRCQRAITRDERMMLERRDDADDVYAMREFY